MRQNGHSVIYVYIHIVKQRYRYAIFNSWYYSIKDYLGAGETALNEMGKYHINPMILQNTAQQNGTHTSCAILRCLKEHPCNWRLWLVNYCLVSCQENIPHPTPNWNDPRARLTRHLLIGVNFSIQKKTTKTIRKGILVRHRYGDNLNKWLGGSDSRSICRWQSG